MNFSRASSGYDTVTSAPVALAPGTVAPSIATGLSAPRSYLPHPFAPCLPALTSPWKAGLHSCEVEVNHTLIVPEFDPELQPIGYTLALELLGEGAYGAPSDGRFLATSTHDFDRFGWEFDTAA
jgi:hypothetical protein